MTNVVIELFMIDFMIIGKDESKMSIKGEFLNFKMQSVISQVSIDISSLLFYPHFAKLTAQEVIHTFW